MSYQIVSDWKPAGDQSTAIKNIVNNFKKGIQTQTLMGVTGSGKTFTIANVIAQLDIPALILAPNKTLAAQLFEEMKALFPNNLVEYFVSYYDYYQPEAFKPASNTYIPKESQRNPKIDQLRHSATRALCESKNVIVVSSVSCLYGLGSVEAYKEHRWKIVIGQEFEQERWFTQLNMMQYIESLNATRGTYILNLKDKKHKELIIYPAHLENEALVIGIKDEIVHHIVLKREEKEELFRFFDIYPNSHHLVEKAVVDKAIKQIEQELKEHSKTLQQLGKIEEKERLEERVERDMQLLKVTLTCPGIENYSRYFSNRDPGSPPHTLYEFFPKPFLCVVDESHIMLPQIKAMSRGDSARKQTLIAHGFRMPSCLDNRPLTFDEWDHIRGKTLFVSATPAPLEREAAITEQIIRPTGLVDPLIDIRPTGGQLEDAVRSAKQVIADGKRVIMLTLTKKMAETLTDFLISIHLKAEYIHADVKTLARIKILQNLRKGVIDIVVGINLLREGIDIPECGLVVIFDGDQEGYLRSQTALIQMFGRAARNETGAVILYADKMTKSINNALEETSRRRAIQIAHNQKHNITPTTAFKSISSAFDELLQAPETQRFFATTSQSERAKYVQELEKKMKIAAENRDFEEAIRLRDALKAIKGTGLLKKESKEKLKAESDVKTI